jgi:hypothetical protein
MKQAHDKTNYKMDGTYSKKQRAYDRVRNNWEIDKIIYLAHTIPDIKNYGI